MPSYGGGIEMAHARAKRIVMNVGEAVDRKATVASLTAEEGQLTQDLASEQARWTDINQRLDELERALGKR
jgi:hypothetical protein